MRYKGWLHDNKRRQMEGVTDGPDVPETDTKSNMRGKAS